MARKEKEIENIEEVTSDAGREDNHAEPRVYELGFHLDPELSQEESKKAYQAVKELISSNGTIVAEGEPEKMQLAYTISRMDTTGRRDFNSAYFAWVAYEATGEGHTAVAEAARTNTQMIRYIDLRSSKEGAKHSSEMQEFYRQAAKENEEVPVDEGSDVELDAALREAGVS